MEAERRILGYTNLFRAECKPAARYKRTRRGRQFGRLPLLQRVFPIVADTNKQHLRSHPKFQLFLLSRITPRESKQ
jgi:hypothetical protein